MSDFIYSIDDYEINTDGMSLATDFDNHDNEDYFIEEDPGLFG